MARWTSAELTTLQSKRLDKKAATRPKGETANRMTANIIRAINMQPGCVAYRVNNTGIWDEAKQIFRKANTEPGLPDIFAVLRGRFAGIEVKAGRDKISQEHITKPKSHMVICWVEAEKETQENLAARETQMAIPIQISWKESAKEAAELEVG